MFFRTI